MMSAEWREREEGGIKGGRRQSESESESVYRQEALHSH